MLGVKLDKARQELKKLNIWDDIEKQKRVRLTYKELMEKRDMKPFYLPEERTPPEIQYEKNVSTRLSRVQTRHLSSKLIEKELISKEKLKEKLLDFPRLLPEINAKYVHVEKKKPKRTSINFGHRSTIISSKDYLSEGTKRSMVDPNEMEKRAIRENSRYPHYRLKTTTKFKKSTNRTIKERNANSNKKESVVNGNNIEVDYALAPIIKKALILSGNDNEGEQRKENLDRTKTLQFPKESGTQEERSQSLDVTTDLNTVQSSLAVNNVPQSLKSNVDLGESKTIDTSTLPPLVIMNHNFLSYPFTKKNPEMMPKGIARNPLGGFYFS